MNYRLVFKPLHLATTFLVIAAAGLAVVSARTSYNLLNSKQPEQTAVANPSDVTKSYQSAVAALGYLEPQGEVIQLSAPYSMESARVEQLLVKRGDRVKAGQVVAILDSRDRLQAILEQAQKQVKVAQARLAQVRAGAKDGEIKAQKSRFQRTKVELEGQIKTQSATIASLKAQLQGEKSSQEATIERIKAELQNAKTECQRYQSLYQDGAVSTSEQNSICLQEKTARERLKEAQATLNRIVNTRQEQINEAKANLNRTVITLQRQIKEAQATLDAIAEVRPVDVQIAQTELEAAQAGVQLAQADLDLAYVRSPRDGQILKIHTWAGEIISKSGIVELGQTNQMYVVAEVYETDISRIRIGQPATITSNRAIRNLQGIVDEVGLQIGTKDVLGTDPVADADARVVEVKIRLTPEDSQRVAGLTNLQVNVVIDTSAS